MRTPARPRLPDGDCVFISGGWIVARANAPGIAADMALLGFAPRCILVHIAFSISKLKNNSSTELLYSLFLLILNRLLNLSLIQS